MNFDQAIDRAISALESRPLTVNASQDQIIASGHAWATIALAIATADNRPWRPR